MTHDIDVLLDSARAGADVTIPPGWGQGRAVFGGVVAGALVARALAEFDADPVTLRSMTTTFLAPATAGPARLAAEILRRGSSASQVEVRLVQPDREGVESVRAVALMTFGATRSSSISVVPAPTEIPPTIDELQPIPYIEGIAPEFLARVDLRPATGAFAFSGHTDGDLTGFMRFREPTQEFGLAHLVTLIDAWPPAPGQMLTAPAPMSTMTWTLDFVAPVDADPSRAWWYDVTTDAAHDGYGHTHARIVDPSGRLVALSRQTVALFG